MTMSTSRPRPRPACAVPVAAVLATALLFTPTGPASGQETRFHETIVIEQVILDIRAVDKSGNTILGLTKDDFAVQVDGQGVELVAVDWISGDEPYAEGLNPEQAAEANLPAAPPGRLVVFFFQTDLTPVRVTGIYRMVPKALEILDGLNPTDQVAVLSFDSHLKLHQDFTADREAVKAVIKATRLLKEPPPTGPGPQPSIAAFLDTQAARDAASPEQGIYLMAHALEAIPGAKSMIFLGYGLGTLRGRAGVMLGSDYARARSALVAARVTVFALDITDADFHDLEVGLERAADDTGGFYQKTHLFPGQAVRRVNQALAGHYVVVFEKPKLPPGTHTVDITLPNHKGTVLGQYRYSDD